MKYLYDAIANVRIITVDTEFFFIGPTKKSTGIKFYWTHEEKYRNKVVGPTISEVVNDESDEKSRSVHIFLSKQ